MNTLSFQKKNNWAYITLIQGDEFASAAVVLSQSLKKSNSSYPLICLAVDVSQRIGELLIDSGCDELRFTKYRGPPLPFSKSQTGYRFKYSSFTKLTIMSMVEFDKLVYLDADVMVMKNIDKMFLFPGPLSAVPSDPRQHDVFNAGVMSLTPSLEKFNKMMYYYNLGEKGGRYNYHSDNKFWNHCFKEHWGWTEMHKWFNFMSKNLKALSEEDAKYILNATYIFHFTGPSKPWSKNENPPPVKKKYFDVWNSIFQEYLKTLAEEDNKLLSGIYDNEERPDKYNYKERNLSIEETSP